MGNNKSIHVHLYFLGRYKAGMIHTSCIDLPKMYDCVHGFIVNVGVFLSSLVLSS